MAGKLRALGVKGALIKAAELGYITELTCGTPKCFCPEEWGGTGYFERRPTRSWSDWEPTHKHFPIPKMMCSRRIASASERSSLEPDSERDRT